jgi:hypothetical protein
MPTTFNYQGNTDNRGNAFTVTDWTEDLTLDCDSDDADLGDVLGTLIKELIQKGVITGSVTSKV